MAHKPKKNTNEVIGKDGDLRGGGSYSTPSKKKKFRHPMLIVFLAVLALVILLMIFIK